MPYNKENQLRAQSEALQEPAFDPVFLLANMGSGAFENYGANSLGGLFNKLASVPFKEINPIIDQIEKAYLHGYSPFSAIADMARGAIGAIRPTLGAQAFGQAIQQPLGYGSVSMGAKPTGLFQRLIEGSPRIQR